MKVAVCAKVVPVAPATIDFATKRRSRRDMELNSPDLHALEEALRLREQLGALEVIVISMAAEDAVSCMRSALALGADRALLVADERLAGSDLLATSRVLERVLRIEAPHLVLFGQQAIDSDGGLLAAAVAERLGWPLVSKLVGMELSAEHALVECLTDEGYERLEAPTPCVLSVLDGANDPRYASARSTLAARAKRVETMTLDEFGVARGDVGESGSGTYIRELAPRSPTRERMILRGGGDAPDRLMALLVERGLIR